MALINLFEFGAAYSNWLEFCLVNSIKPKKGTYLEMYYRVVGPTKTIAVNKPSKVVLEGSEESATKVHNMAGTYGKLFAHIYYTHYLRTTPDDK